MSAINLFIFNGLELEDSLIKELSKRYLTNLYGVSFEWMELYNLKDTKIYNINPTKFTSDIKVFKRSMVFYNLGEFLSGGWHFDKYVYGETFKNYISEFSSQARNIQGEFATFYNFATKILDLSDHFYICCCYDGTENFDNLQRKTLEITDMKIEDLYFLSINTLVKVIRKK